MVGAKSGLQNEVLHGARLSTAVTPTADQPATQALTTLLGLLFGNDKERLARPFAGKPGQERVMVLLADRGMMVLGQATHLGPEQIRSR